MRKPPGQFGTAQIVGETSVNLEVLNHPGICKKPAKKSKYKNKKTKAYGFTFDSKREADRYGILLLMQQAGDISDLRRQVEYRLEVNGFLICKYRADSTYIQDGKLCIEDCKGFRTNEYVLKRKLMKALFGIEILET